MATKQKTVKSPKSEKGGLAQVQKEQRAERKMLADMASKERLMQWLMVGVVVLLLLLLLFFGYATDWLRGLSKDSASTPVTSTLDSASSTNTPGSDAAGANGGATNTGTGATRATGTNTTTNTTTTPGTGTSSTNTSRDTSTSNSTTNNSTTTNNTTTPTQPSPGLLSLYADTSAGGDIASVINQAQLLGISKDCRTDILIQVCNFSDGNLSVTTRNLLGTGIVTSVTKNF